MDRRVPALVSLLLAAGLYAGAALPARRAAAQVEAEAARIRAESEPLRRRVAEGAPQGAAEEAWRARGPEVDASIPGLRRLLLQSIAGVPVSRVRLSVTAAAPPVAARARVAASGSFSDLVALSEQLVGPRTGLVPDRLRWALSGSELGLELEGVILGRTP